MKKVILVLLFIMVPLFFSSGVMNAEDCNEGNALLNKVFANAPDEMTGQYVKMAVQSCPESEEIRKRVAQYFEMWYKKELNPEKQAQYKQLAQDYYSKAIETREGDASVEIKTQPAGLEGGGEFNEVVFRALRPTSPGKTGSGLKLDIHFERGSWQLSDTAQKHLDILGKILSEQPSITISLEGHTDMKGPWDFNKDLSLKRAESAQKYILDKYNIDSGRIIVSGFGFERLADKQNPYSAANRRVEVLKLSD